MACNLHCCDAWHGRLAAALYMLLCALRLTRISEIPPIFANYFVPEDCCISSRLCCTGGRSKMTSAPGRGRGEKTPKLENRIPPPRKRGSKEYPLAKRIRFNWARLFESNIDFNDPFLALMSVPIHGCQCQNPKRLSRIKSSWRCRRFTK